jgi:hypothetical protein
VAEHQQSYEFSAIDSKDILAERQRSWEGFVQFATWGVGITVAILLALLIFVV